MWKEIKLDGKGWARGRNGYFVPRKMEVFSDVRGKINLLVFSRQVGKTEPIALRLSRAEALELGKVIGGMAGSGEKTPRVVVVIEGGNVQEILADKPVDVVKVDYDVDGTPREELKRVEQAGEGGRKSYAYASVRLWGEAMVSLRETGRFFRNALD